MVPYFSGIIVAHKAHRPLYDDKTSDKKIVVPKILMCIHVRVQYYPVTSLYQVKTSGGPVGLYPLNNITGFVLNYPTFPSTARIFLLRRNITFGYETSRRQCNLPSAIRRFQCYAVRVQ